MSTNTDELKRLAEGKLDLKDLSLKHEKWLIGTDDDADLAQEWVMENLPALVAEVGQLRDDQDRAIKYLTQLLTSLWPGTRALEKLNPLISQIDNGLTELKSLRDQSFEQDEADVSAYEEALDVGRDEAEKELEALRAELDKAQACLKQVDLLTQYSNGTPEAQMFAVQQLVRDLRASAFTERHKSQGESDE